MKSINFALPAMFCILALTACRSPERAAHIKAENALGPYSSAVLSDDYCFLSGQIGNKRGGPVTEEITTAIDNVENELRRAGLTLSDVVYATVYQTDIVYYSYFNEIYARRFKAPYPARACVAVKALPGKARVEIQVIAKRR